MCTRSKTGADVLLVSGEEEAAAAETMLLWGIQQPTLSKPNAYVSQSSLKLPLEACCHTLSIIQSPSSLVRFFSSDTSLASSAGLSCDCLLSVGE